VVNSNHSKKAVYIKKKKQMFLINFMDNTIKHGANDEPVGNHQPLKIKLIIAFFRLL